VTGQPFKDWLRQRVLAAGYDVDSARGGRTELAEAAGMSVTQIGRTLNGQTVPSVESCRGLVRALQAKGQRASLAEMMIRTGHAAPEDFPELPEPLPVTIDDAARQWNIAGNDIGVLQAIVKALQARRVRAIPGEVTIDESDDYRMRGAASTFEVQPPTAE
jgi:transcriptional regulator with XRE-family HTH domain